MIHSTEQKFDARTPPETPVSKVGNQEVAQVCVFPASLEQSRYWILDQLEGSATASNMAIAFRLEGAVEDALIEPALRELVARHEALRTTFRMLEEGLSQIISEEPRFALSISDLRSVPPDQAREKAEALILEHGRVHIDLASGPLFAAHLIHVTEHHHFLAFTIHHIVCDGWSNGILVRDFADIYSALAAERAPALPDLPFQFADFTVWQQEWLKTEEAETALAFWQEHIRRDMPAADLPTDHPRSASHCGPGHIESLLLAPELAAKLRTYARQHDATMHQVLLAAFEGLISRYSDQTEFLLGSTIANRTQAGMENVVGRFANPQVILADVHGDPTYRELLERVREWSSKSYGHQDLPFSRLMEAFQLDQSGATSQFLQIYFVYQRAFMQPQQAGALKIVPRPSVSGGVNFDWLVSVVERDEGPRLQVEYNTDLFDRARIRRLLDMYVRVLEAVMHSDTLQVSEFPLLAPSEKTAAESNSLSALPADPGDHSIPSWLDAWIEDHANETAIVAEKKRITWSALEARSRDLAQGLTQLGLKTGQTIAIWMTPTPDAAAAVMAALRLGAVVLPIPKAISAAEWNLILLDLQPAFAIGPSASAEQFASLVGFEKLSRVQAHALSLKDVSPRVSAEQPAWLNVKVDTSGHYHVTAVSHRATLQSLLGAASTLDLRYGDAVLVHPAQGSAPAWTDLLLPLVAGAVTVHAGAIEAGELQELLDREQVAFTFATPEEFAGLIASGWAGDRRLHLVCRGSGISSANLKRLAKLPGKIDVLYSTPLTIGPFAVASYQRSTESSAGEDGARLRPLGGQQLRILDRFGSTAPPGLIGELAVRQASQAGAGARTGYLARTLPDSGIELLDLADRTVRTHGYRLRLSDLESLLYRNPEISTVEATLLRGPAGRSFLIAYITGHQGKMPDVAGVTSRLRTEAPPHLASAEIVAVPRIPRRIDGSPDFSNLPRPKRERSRPALPVEAVPPRDDIESKLVKIWEEVLGVRGIGIRGNFFELGGYSLMIMRLFARVNHAFASSLPITTIFSAPTVEQLANILRGAGASSHLVPVQVSGALPPFFLIHSYLIYDGLRSAVGPERPFYGVRETNSDAEMTVEERAAIYVEEIRSVQPKGPYFLGGWCAAGPLAVETARQLMEAHEAVALVVLLDSWRPGYAAEYAAEQENNPQMKPLSVLGRKYRFHIRNLTNLSRMQRVRYFLKVGRQKFQGSRDMLYLKHWELVQRVFTLFGRPLPHFMHNISRKTLDSVKQYQGQPYPGKITLIRATEAPYFPGADQACGWNKVATGGVDVFFAPGTHQSMFIEPNLSALGEILDNCFRKSTRMVNGLTELANHFEERTNALD